MKIDPDKPIETQLSPFGEFPNVNSEGEEVVQVCDRAAFEAVAAAFEPEMLLDVDHASEFGGSTEAAGWIQSVRVDDRQGLMGTIRFTTYGAELVNERRYRFKSPAWSLGADNRPAALTTVALTNRPNLPIAPVLNNRPSSFVTRHSGGAKTNDDIRKTTTNQKPKENTMDIKALAAMLGLQDTATEAEVTAAIQALIARIADIDAQAIDAEANAAADKAGAALPAANRKAYVEAYKNGDPKGMMAQLAFNVAPVVVKPVVTAAAAKTPSFATANPATNADGEVDHVAKLNSLSGAAKRKYRLAHAEAINKAANAAKA
ncbi:MAG: phage protease [Kiritimatiellaeota bacterium]|nr:phage protease [Kiritimatiellota bacterium]